MTRRERVPAYVGLGSNAGDRRALLSFGLNALLNSGEIDLRALSGIYETEPVGGPPQSLYLNAVALLSTTLEPEALLDRAQAAEALAGRDRGGESRWGPRPLDIDLLAHATAIRASDRLRLPHPYLYEREFVLVPLFEIGIVPGTSIDFERAEAALNRLRGSQGVVQVEGADWL